MNPTPAPEADGPGTPQHRGQDGPAAPGTVEATTVPRQKSPQDPDPAPYARGSDLAPPAFDALDDPDPLRAADAAGTESLLRCWTRENDLPRPDGDTLRIAFPASGTALLVPVHYWSATGAHRFGAPALENAP
ncbi:iron transporter, partial [Streptomyces sp. SID7982]|nr:iron transporter [Streptomyces sp. SID7982]